MFRLKILFVRHGKDDDRYRGGWSQLDLPPEGIEQACELAKHLKGKQSEYHISTIISSDLKRTMSTAQIISEELGIKVISEFQLREMNNGELAGMLNDTALMKYPGLFFNSLDMDEPYPNGETPRDFYLRIKKWFDNFMRNVKDYNDSILAVTHSGVINIIYHIINNIEWTNKSAPFRVSNCSIHVLDTDIMKMELENSSL